MLSEKIKKYVSIQVLVVNILRILSDLFFQVTSFQKFTGVLGIKSVSRGCYRDCLRCINANPSNVRKSNPVVNLDRVPRKTLLLQPMMKLNFFVSIFNHAQQNVSVLQKIYDHEAGMFMRK